MKRLAVFSATVFLAAAAWTLVGASTWDGVWHGELDFETGAAVTLSALALHVWREGCARDRELSVRDRVAVHLADALVASRRAAQAVTRPLYRVR